MQYSPRIQAYMTGDIMLAAVDVHHCSNIRATPPLHALLSEHPWRILCDVIGTRIPYSKTHCRPEPLFSSQLAWCVTITPADATDARPLLQDVLELSRAGVRRQQLTRAASDLLAALWASRGRSVSRRCFPGGRSRATPHFLGPSNSSHRPTHSSIINHGRAHCIGIVY